LTKFPTIGIRVGTFPNYNKWKVYSEAMDQKEGISSNKSPMIKGNDYALWSVRMKNYLMALGCDVWQVVESGYTTPSTPPTNTNTKKLYNDNSRVVNAILGGLTNPIFVKVMYCKSTKYIWDKLKVIYEGDNKVKEAKLQTYKTQFENLKMKEEENIAKYLQRVDEIINSIRALREERKHKPIFQNILRSLAMRYDAKISTLEDRPDLDKLIVDKLYGILIAYEMTIGQEIPPKEKLPSRHQNQGRSRSRYLMNIYQRYLMKK